VILSFFQLGCSENKSDDSPGSLPHLEFEKLSSYLLSDFDLPSDVAYWEARRGSLPQSEWRDSIGYSYEDDLLFSFDEIALEALTVQQKDSLNQADSEYGFSSQCQPSYCPIYGVSILGDSAVVISSDSDLLAHFGNIDTVAELHFWLWAQSYNAKFYQEVGGGYLVVVGWDNLCGTRGEDLLYVDYNGTITKQREISTEEYSGCV